MSQLPQNQSYEMSQPSSGLAIASMVLGIVSLFFCLWYIAIPCGILAIVFGVMAGNKAKMGQAGGAGMARAGIIMGCIGLAIDAIAVILVFTVGLTFMKGIQKSIQQQQQQQQMQQQQPPQPNPVTPSPATSPSASIFSFPVAVLGNSS